MPADCLQFARHGSELKPLVYVEVRRRTASMVATDLDERRGTEDRIQLIIDTTPAFLHHSAVPEGSLDYLNRAS